MGDLAEGKKGSSDAIFGGAHPSKTAKGEAAEGGGGAKVGQPPDISADPVLTVPHLTPDLLLTDLCKREEPTVTAGPPR